uniref:Putative product n=1 Tax=Xenopsylla cheopis TaxID=163159 RepID=A0A6M2DZ09_XENCH
MEGAVVLLVYALALFFSNLRIWLANLVRRISPFVSKFLRRIFCNLSGPGNLVFLKVLIIICQYIGFLFPIYYNPVGGFQ